MVNQKTPLNLALIARDGYRIAQFKQSLAQTGLKCRLQRLEPDSRVPRFLAQNRNGPAALRFDLLFVDLAETDAELVTMVQRLALPGGDSRVPVVLLTSPGSEAFIDAGELDDGKATMFSPKTLPVFLRKLTGPRRKQFLRAIAVLYQYGPILVRQPNRFLEPDANETRLSA